jgi:hypothetical protein
VPTTIATTTTTTAGPTTTTTLGAPVTEVLADVRTEAKNSNRNFGTSNVLSADGDSAKYTFLRVRVTGIGPRAITRAAIRLQTPDESAATSDSGGRIRAMSDCTWSELGVTFNNQPNVTGAVLSTVGSVGRNAVVEFAVTPAVPGDGTYCFVIDSASDDGVDYHSREAASGRPAFVVSVAP